MSLKLKAAYLFAKFFQAASNKILRSLNPSQIMSDLILKQPIISS